MAITNGYATLEDLKTVLNIKDDEGHDTRLEAVITAVSRAIDGLKGLKFFTASGDKFLTAHFADELHVPPCVSVSAVATDSENDWTYATTIDSADYRLDGSPVHTIRLRPGSGKSFPLGKQAVKVSAAWGYSSTTPEPIAEACLIASARLYRRKDAHFGVVGGGATIGGVTIQTHLRGDIDFMMLLNSITYAEVY